MTTEIRALGTTHSSSKSKRRITEILNSEKFDIVFLEVGNKVSSLNFKLFALEPVFCTFCFFYARILAFKGSEFTHAEEICKKKGIRVVHMDVSLPVLIEKMHHWFNYGLFILLLSFSVWWFAKIATIQFMYIAAPVASILLYSVLQVLLTSKFRDQHFHKVIEAELSRNENSRVLVLCGRYHIDALTQNYKNVHVYS